MDVFHYCSQNEKDIYKEFGSAKNIGLTSQQVSQKLNKYGKNLLPHQQISALNIFIRQLKSPFIYLLIIASIITFLLKHHIDGIFILFFVAVDIIFGFFQEYRSEKTIEILNQYHQNKVKVIRNGMQENIDSAEIVPGDLLLFQSGDTFAADVRIVEAKELQKMHKSSIIKFLLFIVLKISDFVAPWCQRAVVRLLYWQPAKIANLVRSDNLLHPSAKQAYLK